MMNFGDAIQQMKAGHKVARAGWNGKGMHLRLEVLPMWRDAGGDMVMGEPCIVMFTAQGRHQPGWLASQADMLAEDWQIAA